MAVQSPQGNRKDHATNGSHVPLAEDSQTSSSSKEKKTPIPEQAVVRQPSEADTQAGSLLFQRLPQELRHEIYALVFSPVELTLENMLDKDNEPRHSPFEVQLALLLTCRRARAEIGDTWVNSVSFSFPSAGTMLDKLTGLGPALYTRVRRLHVAGDDSVLDSGYGSFLYHLHSAFVLLPGLRLDTLTVYGTGKITTDKENLDEFVNCGQGWKELRFIIPTSEILFFPMFSHRDMGWSKRQYRRQPQPGHWRGVLQARDGEEAGSSVELFRTIHVSIPMSLVDLIPEARTPFEQEMPADAKSRKAYGIIGHWDAALMGEEEEDKAVLVVVKRGAVDYEVKEESRLLKRDIREKAEESTWREIRARYGDSLFQG